MDTARLKKQVALLRKMGMFNPADETFAIRRAHTAADLEAAYRLVHDSFVEKGYINQQPGGMRIRPYEMVPQTATFICEHKERGEIVAVMSVVVDSLDMGLPSDHAFQDELDELRSQGRRVCEFTNLAVAGKYWRSNAFTALTQACHAQARYTGCDDVFVAISPGHANFFESVLVFEKCGEPRNYSSATTDIVQGERLNLQTAEKRSLAFDRQVGEMAFLHDYYFEKNPFTKLVPEWEEKMQPDWSIARHFHTLLTAENVYFENCSEIQLTILRNRWGNTLFKEIYEPNPLAQPQSVFSSFWHAIPFEVLGHQVQSSVN